MKIKFGALVTDGRGKIGGHVASKNRGGAYLRTKVTPVNPQSVAQSFVRALFATLSQAWRSLTEAQRTAWNNAVAQFGSTNVFGDIKNPSGSNLYLKLNQNLGIIGQPAISEPPAVTDSPYQVNFTATVNGTAPAISIVLTDGAVPADTAIVLEMTAPQSAGKSFLKNQYRVVTTYPSATATPINALAAYEAKFGPLVPGKKVAIRIKAISEVSGIAGQYSQLVKVAL